MAMTVEQSSAVNVVLDHLLGAENRPGVDGGIYVEPTEKSVLEAARILATGSSKRLQAGWNADAVPLTLPVGPARIDRLVKAAAVVVREDMGIMEYPEGRDLRDALEALDA